MNERGVDTAEGKTIRSIHVEVAGKMGVLPSAVPSRANGRPGGGVRGPAF